MLSQQNPIEQPYHYQTQIPNQPLMLKNNNSKKKFIFQNQHIDYDDKKNPKQQENKNLSYNCIFQQMKDNNKESNSKIFKQLEQLDKLNQSGNGNQARFQTEKYPKISIVLNARSSNVYQNSNALPPPKVMNKLPLPLQSMESKKNYKSITATKTKPTNLQTLPNQQNYQTQYRNQQNLAQNMKSQKRTVQKLIENKLNQIIQNKRKSISHRAFNSSGKQSKQNQSHTNGKDKSVVEKSKIYRKNASKQEPQNIKRAVFIPFQHQQSTILKKIQNKQKLSNQPSLINPSTPIKNQSKQASQPCTVNRQKQSHSTFVIRKKINSINILQQMRNPTVKQDMIGKSVHTHIKKYRKDRFVKDIVDNELQKEQQQKEKNNSRVIQNIKQQIMCQPQHQNLQKQLNHKSILDSNKCIHKEQNEQNMIKQIKNHHYPASMKGVKCIKIRMNPTKLLPCNKSTYAKSHLSRLPIEQAIQQPNIIVEQDQIKFSQCSQSLNYKKLVNQQKLNAQLSEKNHLQCSQSHQRNKLQPQNQYQQQSVHLYRKSRISSIRAIKNYISQNKSNTMVNHCGPSQNQGTEKEIGQKSKKNDPQSHKRKKQRQPSNACLTHKIKWGSSKKKLLVSQRMFEFMAANNLDNGHQGDYMSKQENQNQNRIKKHQKQKVKFAQDNYLDFDKIYLNRLQHLNQQKKQPSKQLKRQDKIFAQTINSKQFISDNFSLQVPFHNIGSKSLIIFQDPGLSVIVNKNNSNHHEYRQNPSKFTTLQHNDMIADNQQQSKIKHSEQKRSKQYLGSKKKCDYKRQQNFRNNSDDIPLQSLQQLYYELKSFKSINIKQEDMKIESLRDLCEQKSQRQLQSVCQ